MKLHPKFLRSKRTFWGAFSHFCHFSLYPRIGGTVARDVRLLGSGVERRVAVSLRNGSQWVLHFQYKSLHYEPHNQYATSRVQQSRSIISRNTYLYKPRDLRNNSIKISWYRKVMNRHATFARNGFSWEERIEYEKNNNYEYTEKIIFLTLMIIMKKNSTKIKIIQLFI